MKRPEITSKDGQGPDHIELDLSMGAEKPDMAIVTDDSMSSPHVQEYARDLAFMEDVLTIVVGETENPNAENPVQCGVNGEHRKFYRGQEYKTQRKFVDSLIRTVFTVTTKQFKDADNLDQTKMEKRSSQAFPISIIHDPAGSTGHRWFMHQMRNAY